MLLAIQRLEARGAIESAHRFKQLGGQVFRYAAAIGLAERDVTADLKGALPAIPRTYYPAITEPLRSPSSCELSMATQAMHMPLRRSSCRRCFFVRPGELRGAEWTEIDLAAAEWHIPGTKMKMKNDHIVPSASQALAILENLHRMTGHGKYVFPSIRTDDRCMSENTVNACLRSMGFGKEVMTAHGFRAMARTILDEVLKERVDLIEHQLAHAVKDINGRTYNRTAHLPARRLMMQHWADYLDKLRVGADVIKMIA